MSLRKCVASLLTVAMLGLSINKSQAFEDAPVVVVTTTSSAAGVAATGAFLGVVAVICLVDFMQKLNGTKNWDGSPKPMRTASRRHHHRG